MKKASDVILLINAILGFVAVAVYAIIAIVMLSIGGNREAIIEGINNGSFHTSFSGSVEEQALAIQVTLITVGVILIFGLIFSLIAAIVSLKAKNKGTTGLYVASMIFSFFGGTYLGIVGGIFGLIASSNN